MYGGVEGEGRYSASVSPEGDFPFLDLVEVFLGGG